MYIYTCIMTHSCNITFIAPSFAPNNVFSKHLVKLLKNVEIIIELYFERLAF